MNVTKTSETQRSRLDVEQEQPHPETELVLREMQMNALRLWTYRFSRRTPQCDMVPVAVRSCQH